LDPVLFEEILAASIDQPSLISTFVPEEMRDELTEWSVIVANVGSFTSRMQRHRAFFWHCAPSWTPAWFQPTQDDENRVALLDGIDDPNISSLLSNADLGPEIWMEFMEIIVSDSKRPIANVEFSDLLQGSGDAFCVRVLRAGCFIALRHGRSVLIVSDTFNVKWKGEKNRSLISRFVDIPEYVKNMDAYKVMSIFEFFPHPSYGKVNRNKEDDLDALFMTIGLLHAFVVWPDPVFAVSPVREMQLFRQAWTGLLDKDCELPHLTRAQRLAIALVARQQHGRQQLPPSPKRQRQA